MIQSQKSYNGLYRVFGCGAFCRRKIVTARTNVFVVKTVLSHTPVLLNEVISFFEQRQLNTLLDCTLGYAGHTSALLQRHPELKTIVGVDMDNVALQYAKQNLQSLATERSQLQMHLLKGNFKDLPTVLCDHNPRLDHLLQNGFDGILMDLGMSSLQVDDPDRGFSFMKDGPLDMRMDSDADLTAAHIVNTWSAFDLSTLFRQYGEENRAAIIARRICEARAEKPIETTQELVSIIGRNFSRRKSFRRSIHPATRIFQALRIAVNQELNSLEEALPYLLHSLSDDGLLCVISFHSLEDRIVKWTFRHASSTKTTPSAEAITFAFDNNGRQNIRHSGRLSSPSIETSTTTTTESVILGQILTKKPVVPTKEEMASNRRSSSAKLRVFRRRFDIESDMFKRSGDK